MRKADYLSLSLRSLRRSKVRSLLTIFAIVIGATGITVMLTFVTSVKNLTVASFVKTGQILQIQVSQQNNLQYDPNGINGGHGDALASSGNSASAPKPLTAALESNIATLPHVAAVSAMFRSRNPSLSHILYKGKQWVIEVVVGYEPNGVIAPALVAGRTLTMADTHNEILISRPYADVMGYSKNYSALIGQKFILQTNNGYTGAGATLPNKLPPQVQCDQNKRGCFGGPTSGLPSMNIPATVVGVLEDDGSRQPLIMMPLSLFVGIYNASTPNNVRYDFQNQGNRGNNQGNNQGNGSVNNQGNGPGNNQGPPQGSGTVIGGWVRPTTTEFFANNGGFDSLMAKADKLENVASVARNIETLGVSTTTGLAALNEQKAQANVIGLVLGALGFVALFIAALGVMNTMIMSVLQRTREIGVMRALGARRRTIRRIFTIEATAIGFLGGFIGVALGSIFVLVAKPVITNMVKAGSLTGATFTVPPWLMLMVIAGTSLIGFISGFFPARRAANLDPVEALRYE